MFSKVLSIIIVVCSISYIGISTHVHGQSALSTTELEGSFGSGIADGVESSINQDEQATSDLDIVLSVLTAPQKRITDFELIEKLYTAANWPLLEEASQELLLNDNEHPQVAKAFYYFNKALYEQRKPIEVELENQRIYYSDLEDWQLSDLLRMQAKSAYSQGHPLQTAAVLLEELSTPYSIQSSTSVEIINALKQVTDAEALTKLLDTHQDLDWLEDLKSLLLVQAQIAAGSINQAVLDLSSISRYSYLDNPIALKMYDDINLLVKEQASVVPYKIGVLLPLGSKSSLLNQLSQDILDGLRMVIQRDDKNSLLQIDFQQTEYAEIPYPENIQLVIRDTKNDPKLAQDYVRELALEEHVLAIIGPVALGESQAAATTAEQLEIPLISLSVSLNIKDDSFFVFKNNMGYAFEIKTLIAYAMDYAHAQNFVIIYPQNSYGLLMRDLFWEEVNNQGGQIVNAASYKPWNNRRSGTDFDSIFKEITGLDPNASTALDSEENEPVINFDAIFMPIGINGEQDIRLISPYPATVGAEDTLILGTRNWNSYTMLIAAENRLDGSIFVDRYNIGQPNLDVEGFRDLHHHLYGYRYQYQMPSNYTALAYDTLQILRNILRRQGYQISRLVMASELHTMKPHQGISGVTSFRSNGQVLGEGQLYSYEGSSIIPLIDSNQ